MPSPCFRYGTFEAAAKIYAEAVNKVCRSRHMLPDSLTPPQIPPEAATRGVLQSRPATLLKKKLWHSCFPVNFAEFLRAPFLQNTSGRLLLRFTMLQNSFKSISVDAIV